MAKKTAIKCPHCGREYLPGEIYDPKSFLGQPHNIIRDGSEILAFDGADMDTIETYICDECGTEFKVDAVVTFKTEVVDDMFEDDFDVEEDKLEESGSKRK